MSRQQQRDEWNGKRTIHGPYSEGESDQDKRDREEGERTSKLVMRVIVVMAVLLALYTVTYLIFQ